jgi:diguanylate cyclase (GGDEF)-like protein
MEAEKMKDRRGEPRRRILRPAKIAFNQRGSTIDCLLRNLSDVGACLEVASHVGVPDEFELLIDGEAVSRRCVSVWQIENKIGVEFRDPSAPMSEEHDKERHSEAAAADVPTPRAGSGEGAGLLRGELFSLRAALDEIEVGVVLLDAGLRAQFINRAFRKMWRLPDAKADAKPSFAALMHHGAETGAYEVPSQDLPAYIAERVEAVIAGDAGPRDLRLRNGEVLRFQCAALPAGGRMLSYTYVTDIARQADELAMLRAATDSIEQGVILLDAELNAQFMNRAVRRQWGISDEQAERRPPYAELLGEAHAAGADAVEGLELEALISLRVAHARAGSSKPMDLRAADGRVIRSRCAVLPNGGRMLTFGDVTDLVHHADELETLARIDALTGIPNRRHFLELAEIEWNRFGRYQRPLSVMMIDVDQFKSINDAFGHQAGDQVLSAIAQTLASVRRHSDAVGRIGGDEFAVLLPETTLAQAKMAAERLIRSTSQQEIDIGGKPLRATISVGVAEAWDAAADFAALMNRADQALYQAKSAGRNRVEIARPTSASALAIG